jgi:tRNA modification GTPase
MPDTETLAACLTPPGIGAIATIALRGPRAWAILHERFRPLSDREPWPPIDPDPGRLWLGRFSAAGVAGDEIVLAQPKSGPAPWLELHCHGGVEVVRWLLEALAAGGARISTWHELERYTAGNLRQADAVVALAEALTARTASILLDQYEGAFQRAVDAICAALDGGKWAQATAKLEDIARQAPLGRHLTAPWRVAVLGAPNVGKSSLVNALVGFQRSIVAPTPGTTRDVVTALVAVDGWPVELVDTAGIRAEASSLEAQGIARARAAAREADLCLWVLDAAQQPAWPAPDLPALHLVVNKIDLPSVWDLRSAPGAITVSALTGSGIERLSEALARWLVFAPPAPGDAVPFTSRMAAQVEEARDYCGRGQFHEAARVLRGIFS